ncbi:MAG: YdgA family protein [Gilliamella apicola]|nr:YdgA family protein [Gilliamella apicola]
MKKSIVATGVIAILAFGYIGTSMHTGNLIEENLDTDLAVFAQQVNSSQQMFNLQISHNNDEKGIFSTKTHLKVTLTQKNQIINDDDGSVIVLYDDDATIHHGPFPLAALANGSFSPQLAWLEFAITEKTNPTLWKLAGNKPYISGHAGLSYSDYLTVKLATESIKLTHSDFDLIEDDGIFELGKWNIVFEKQNNESDLTMQASLDKLNLVIDPNNVISFNGLNMSFKPEQNKTTVDYDINISSLKMKSIEYGSYTDIDFNDLTSKGNVNYKDYKISDQSEINRLTVSTNRSTSNAVNNIELNKFVLNQQMELNPKNHAVDGSLFTSVDSIIYGKQNLGNGSLDLNFKGFDKKDIFNRFYMDYLDDLEDFVEDMPFNTTLTLNKFNWHNDAGDININFVLDINDLNYILNSGDDTGKDIDERIDTFKLKVEAPFDVMAQFYAQFENPQNSEVTEQQVNSVKSNIMLSAEMFLGHVPIFVFNNGKTDGIFSDISVTKDSDEVQVNGETMSKKFFFNEFK